MIKLEYSFMEYVDGLNCIKTPPAKPGNFLSAFYFLIVYQYFFHSITSLVYIIWIGSTITNIKDLFS